MTAIQGKARGEGASPSPLSSRRLLAPAPSSAVGSARSGEASRTSTRASPTAQAQSGRGEPVQTPKRLMTPSARPLVACGARARPRSPTYYSTGVHFRARARTPDCSFPIGSWELGRGGTRPAERTGAWRGVAWRPRDRNRDQVATGWDRGTG
jgi:hypothetical protein